MISDTALLSRKKNGGIPGWRMQTVSGKRKSVKKREPKTKREKPLLITLKGLQGGGDLSLPDAVTLEVRCTKRNACFSLSQLMLGDWTAVCARGVKSKRRREDTQTAHFNFDLDVYGTLTKGTDGRLILTQAELVRKRRKKNGKG